MERASATKTSANVPTTHGLCSVAASSDGYLPSSWTVTPKGDLAFTLPLAVPPGRAGMAPSLALGYASGSGNGLVGVGWSVTGFSTIARGGRVLARDGATDGVDYSVRDRFYLDGQELVGVTATLVRQQPIWPDSQ